MNIEYVLSPDIGVAVSGDQMLWSFSSPPAFTVTLPFGLRLDGNLEQQISSSVRPI